jgi:hypothetical protein
MAKKKPATKKKATKKAATRTVAAKKAVRKKAGAKKAAPKKAVAKRRTGMKASPVEPMIVIASGERPLREVSRELTAAGFQVGDVLDAIGQVTGHAPRGLKARLKKIRGVSEVTGTHPYFDIGPPGAPIS